MDHDVQAGGDARKGHFSCQGLFQRINQRLTSLAISITQAAQMALKMAFGDEIGNGRLSQGWRAAINQRQRPGKGVTKAAGSTTYPRRKAGKSTFEKVPR